MRGYETNNHDIWGLFVLWFLGRDGLEEIKAVDSNIKHDVIIFPTPFQN